MHVQLWSVERDAPVHPFFYMADHDHLIINQRTSGPANAHLTPGPSLYFNVFIHVNSPRTGADNPLGTNIWWQQKALIISTICCKFQTNLFEFWFFYTFFNVFQHVYSPGAEADNPLWTKSWCQQKSLVTLPICCKFQKHIFEVWFYTYFFMFLYMDIAGADHPWGQIFYVNIYLMSLRSFAVSFFHWMTF